MALSLSFGQVGNLFDKFGLFLLIFWYLFAQKQWCTCFTSRPNVSAVLMSHWMLDFSLVPD